MNKLLLCSEENLKRICLLDLRRKQKIAMFCLSQQRNNETLKLNLRNRKRNWSIDFDK